MMPATPSDQPDLRDATKLALQYAKEASERARKIIVLLSVASVITFIAWWNQYQHGWTTQRFQTAQDAMRYLCAEALDNASRTGVKPPDWTAESCSVGDSALPPLDDKRKVMLRDYLTDWQFTRKQLERQIQDLQDQYVSGVLKINMPFFGLSSDVNDLGILSGIALVALMALLLFTIWREEQNVAELFDVAQRSGELPRILRLFSMTQVFTIPPQHPKVGAKRITFLIYSLPVMTYGLVAGYDSWQTFKQKTLFRQPIDWVTLAIEVVVLAAIICMRYQLWVIVRRIDELWKNYSQPPAATRAGHS